MASSEEKFTDISFISWPQSLQVIWKIQDFFALSDTDMGYTIKSPPFIFANAKWCIHFYPLDDVDGLYYSLERLNSLITDHEIISICYIASSGDEKYVDKQYDKLVFKENCVGHHEGYLSTRSELSKKQDELAPDGTLTLVWHLLSAETKKEIIFSQNVMRKEPSSDILCQNFKSLLLNGTDSDLTLKVKDKEFHVHRIILRARSPVFQSMLTHDMIEKNSGVVDIPDCDPKAMEQLLLYIYSGDVDALNKNNMLGLYYAADKYNMMDLKAKCQNFIRNSVSCSNICDILQLALNHSDDDLLDYATDFFVNNTNEILITVQWMLFLKENVITANELLIKASKKWNEANQVAKCSQKLKGKSGSSGGDEDGAQSEPINTPPTDSATVK